MMGETRQTRSDPSRRNVETERGAMQSELPRLTKAGRGRRWNMKWLLPTLLFVSVMTMTMLSNSILKEEALRDLETKLRVPRPRQSFSNVRSKEGTSSTTEGRVLIQKEKNETQKSRLNLTATTTPTASPVKPTQSNTAPIGGSVTRNGQAAMPIDTTNTQTLHHHPLVKDANLVLVNQVVDNPLAANDARNGKRREQMQQSQRQTGFDMGQVTSSAAGDQDKAHVQSGKGQGDWQSVVLNREYTIQTFPPDFVGREYPLDPLSEEFDVSTLRRLNLTIGVTNLGVLLDAGRHYFPVEWIKRMIHVLSVLNYNLLHFRLTDDQAFNVQLESQPLLAYPSRLFNNTKVYQPGELRDIVKYAKERGITVIPEINVPGHAGAWGGMPELIVQCPMFICGRGYGVPLNVTNPKLRSVLKDVLTEVIDIFDRPPLLHLGGDEVEMSIPCMNEVGAAPFDYNVFEEMLREVLLEAGYDESRVIRWEMMKFQEGLSRAGNITHFWFTQPGHRGTGIGVAWNRFYDQFEDPVFNSQGLYFDVNDEDAAWEVYVKSKQLQHLRHEESPNLGIIAGTFELGTGHWLDRNVIGKLLAVSIGASKNVNATTDTELYAAYNDMCRAAGFREDLCKMYAHAPLEYSEFRKRLKNGRTSTWAKWQADICHRFTSITDGHVYINPYSRSHNGGNAKRKTIDDAKAAFWRSVEGGSHWQVMDDNLFHQSKSPLSPLNGLPRLVRHNGVIISIPQDPVKESRMDDIIMQSMSPMGLNLAQVVLVDDVAFSYQSAVHPEMHFSIPLQNLQGHEYLTAAGLKTLRSRAEAVGVAIMPEVSFSTNAGGMFNSRFNVECPTYTCQQGAKALPQNVNDADYVPVVYSIVREVLRFSSSPYFHLGYDERHTAESCFKEALHTGANFGGFENKLATLLQISNVTHDQVIRWENKDRFEYPRKVGAITQCRPGDTVCPQIRGSNGTRTPWWATIDIRRGGPLEIFNTTRSMLTLEHRPLGIVADLGGLSMDFFAQNQINMRLLAFSLATIDFDAVPANDNSTATRFVIRSQDDFRSHFVRLCNELFRHLEENACSDFVTQRENSISLAKEEGIMGRTYREHLTTITCNHRTQWTKTFQFRNDTIPTALSLNEGLVSVSPAL